MNYANIGRLSSDLSAVENWYITAFTRFVILFFLLYGYLISNTSNAKIGSLFYFTLIVLNIYTTDYSIYFVNCRRTKKAVRHTQFLGFGKNIYIDYRLLIPYMYTSCIL